MLTLLNNNLLIVQGNMETKVAMEDITTRHWLMLKTMVLLLQLLIPIQLKMETARPMEEVSRSVESLLPKDAQLLPMLL